MLAKLYGKMTTKADKLELPAQMEVIRQGGQIVILRRWPRFEAIPLGVFGAFIGWEILGRNTFRQLVQDGAIINFATQPFGDYFPLIFALPAIWMMYFCVAGLVNRTRITLSLDGISVHHGPLPWPGNVSLERTNLKQFHIKTTFARGALSNHKVQALLRNDKIVTVVNGPGLSRQQATYINRALQQAFRTADAKPQDAVIAEAGLTIRREGANLEIVKRWFDQYTIRKAVFAVLWLAFTGWMTWAWHTSFGAIPFWPFDPVHTGLPILIQSMLLGTGVVLAYRAAAGLLNRTIVMVSRERLSIRHGPLPWRGNEVIAVSNLSHLQLKKSAWTRRAGPGRPPIHTYEIHAVLTDGFSRKLAGGFDKSVQAQQLKQAIEGLLALKPVQTGVQTGLAVSGNVGIKNAPGGEMPHGRKAGPSIGVVPARARNNRVRVAASFLGLLAMAGGLFLMASVGELHRDGATVMSMVIRGLVAFLPLFIGLMLLGAANNLKGDRVWLFLYCATVAGFATLLLLLLIYGGRPEYVVKPAVVNTLPAGVGKNGAVAAPFAIGKARVA